MGDSIAFLRLAARSVVVCARRRACRSAQARCRAGGSIRDDGGDAMSYQSNTTAAEVAQRLSGAQRVLLATHAKPDGDAMGSVLALARALTSQGKAAEIF